MTFCIIFSLIKPICTPSKSQEQRSNKRQRHKNRAAELELKFAMRSWVSGERARLVISRAPGYHTRSWIMSNIIALFWIHLICNARNEWCSPAFSEKILYAWPKKYAHEVVIGLSTQILEPGGRWFGGTKGMATFGWFLSRVNDPVGLRWPCLQHDKSSPAKSSL